jgi:hypothetical protein
MQTILIIWLGLNGAFVLFLVTAVYRSEKSHRGAGDLSDVRMRKSTMPVRRKAFTYIPLAQIKPIACPRCGEKARAVWHHRSPQA